MKSIIDRLSLGDLLRWFFPGYLTFVSYYFTLTDHSASMGPYRLPTEFLREQHLYILPALLIGIIASALYRSLLDYDLEVECIKSAMDKDHFKTKETDDEKLFFEYHKQIWCAGDRLSEALRRFDVWADVNYFLLTSAFTILAGLFASIVLNISNNYVSIATDRVVILFIIGDVFLYAGWINSERTTIAKQVVISELKLPANDTKK